jgi:hypothetical protein
MHLPTRLDASLGQSFEQVVPVDVIDEDVLLAVAAVHDVVDRARLLREAFGVRRIPPLSRLAVVSKC